MRGRYISKEERIRLKEKDDRVKEVLMKHGIEIMKVEDTHQHRYTTITLKKGGIVEKFMFENSEQRWGQLKPTPIALHIASLLLTADLIENFVKGMKFIEKPTTPRGIYLSRLEEFLERMERIFGDRLHREALMLDIREVIGWENT